MFNEAKVFIHMHPLILEMVGWEEQDNLDISVQSESWYASKSEQGALRSVFCSSGGAPGGLGR